MPSRGPSTPDVTWSGPGGCIQCPWPGARHLHVCLAHGGGTYRRGPLFQHCGFPELLADWSRTWANAGALPVLQAPNGWLPWTGPCTSRCGPRNQPLGAHVSVSVSECACVCKHAHTPPPFVIPHPLQSPTPTGGGPSLGPKSIGNTRLKGAEEKFSLGCTETGVRGGDRHLVNPPPP